MKAFLLQRFIKMFLLAAGIFDHQRRTPLEHLYSLFITAIFIIQIIGNYIGYKAGNMDLEQIVEMVFRLVGHTYVLLIHWFIKLNKSRVLKITQTLSGIYPSTVISSNEVTRITEESFKSIGILTLSIYSMAMLTYMLMSIFIGLFTKLKADDVYIYLFPYWYTCKNRNFTLAMFCWNVNSYSSYLLKNASQFSLMFIEQLSLFNSVFLYLILIFNFQAHFIIIQERLRNVKAEADKFNVLYWETVERTNNRIEYWKRKHDDKVDKGIVEFIRYHQFLCSQFVEIKPVLSGLLSQVLFFIWLLMLFTLCFIMVEENGSFIYRMKVGSLVVMTILVFYLTCYLGEFMSKMNHLFLNLLYSGSWLELPISSKKIMSIQFILLQKPFRIKAFGMYLINMERFAFSIKTMYTVLNMLLITLKKI